MIKTLTLGLAAFGLALTVQAQQLSVTSTNLTTAGGTFLMLNRADVQQVQLLSTQGGQVNFFNCPSNSTPLWGTNYTLPANVVTRGYYATNMASTWVDPMGITNWYTNAGIFTYSTTNTVATTNALTPSLSFVVTPNITATFNVDALFDKGVILQTALTNLNAILYYTTGK
jgi:hypothetical protein